MKVKLSKRVVKWIATFIVTCCALIAPALGYLFLWRGPEIRYASSWSRIVVPDEISSDKVRAILDQNNIPDSTVYVSLVNRGAHPAKEVELRMLVPGRITVVKSYPDPQDNPAWLTMSEPSLEMDDHLLAISLRNFGRGRFLFYCVGYVSEDAVTSGNIEVFFDGSPAEEEPLDRDKWPVDSLRFAATGSSGSTDRFAWPDDPGASSWIVDVKLERIEPDTLIIVGGPVSVALLATGFVLGRRRRRRS